MLKKIKNGNPLEINEKEKYILFIDNNNQELAIYKNIKINCFCAFKVF